MRGIQAFFPPARKEHSESGNPSRHLLERWVDRKKRSFDLILTEDILDEYKEVLNRLRIRAAHTGNLIASLRRGGVLVQPWYSVEISPDPADDIFFAAAIAGKAQAIITSNPKHFPPVNGIRILSPNDALKEIP
jgi:predicted nucleic acid-binding protein